VAAQKAGDLALAEQSTRQSIAKASERNIKAASLYNLGAILFAKGDRAGAIDAYKQSLKERNTGAVRRALAALDPSAAAAFDPFAPRAMLGPFPSLKAVYDSFEAAHRVSDPRPSENKALKSPPAPWREVQVLATQDPPPDGETDSRYVEYTLAARTAAGWFACGEPFASAINTGRHMGSIGIDELAARDVIAGGAPEIVVRYGEQECETQEDGEWCSDTEQLVLAGVGASGKPSCTQSILVEYYPTDGGEWLKGAERAQRKLAVPLKFVSDGIEIANVPKGIPAQQRSELLGKHLLVFP
jgi:hypothetical protein